MARQHATPVRRNGIETQGEARDQSLGDGIEALSPTAVLADQLITDETPEQARDRQLAAFQADQQDRGVAIRIEVQHEDEYVPLTKGRGLRR